MYNTRILLNFKKLCVYFLTCLLKFVILVLMYCFMSKLKEIGRKTSVVLVLGMIILPAVTGVVSAFGGNKILRPKPPTAGPPVTPITPPGQAKPKPPKPSMPSNAAPPAHSNAGGNR